MNKLLLIACTLLCFAVFFIRSIENNFKFPIVYSNDYNTTLYGLEKLHPFDAVKYQRIHTELKEYFKLTDSNFYTPEAVTDEDLQKVHTKQYLDSLHSSYTLAWIMEMGFLAFIPNFLLQRYLLNGMRLATGGTILASQIALDKNNPYNFAINLGAGYHHAGKDVGGGFCAFADIPLAIKLLWETDATKKIFYLDLDAHQGNGVELILEDELKEGKRFFVFDVYGGDTYPADKITQFLEKDATAGAKKIQDFITYNHPITPSTKATDEYYLNLLYDNLEKSIDETNPDIIFYNAGTDILQGDAVGFMNVSADGIKQRDELVFRLAKQRNIPVVMTLSGGYTKQSAPIIAQSIINIIERVHGVKSYYSTEVHA